MRKIKHTLMTTNFGLVNSGQKPPVIWTISDKIFLPTSAATNVQKWSPTEPLLKFFLAKSLVVELLSTLLVEDKVQIRILSSPDDKIGPGKHF